MKTLERLNKNEMKMIVGGSDEFEPGGGCAASTCSSNSDCTEKAFPKCYLTTCNETGVASNFCGVASQA